MNRNRGEIEISNGNEKLIVSCEDFGLVSPVFLDGPGHENLGRLYSADEASCLCLHMLIRCAGSI